MLQRRDIVVYAADKGVTGIVPLGEGQELSYIGHVDNGRPDVRMLLWTPAKTAFLNVIHPPMRQQRHVRSVESVYCTVNVSKCGVMLREQ